ncbi:hypothetical protein GCM10010271_07320 [Streptomyces kurssanovii]|nr:hypothetical protein GCM10010271_07320 [Streptomyces kurssanovii]
MSPEGIVQHSRGLILVAAGRVAREQGVVDGLMRWATPGTYDVQDAAARLGLAEGEAHRSGLHVGVTDPEQDAFVRACRPRLVTAHYDDRTVRVGRYRQTHRTQQQASEPAVPARPGKPPLTCKNAGREPMSRSNSMMRTMFKSKIHRATVTQADLHYVGSVTVDRDLMDAADLLPGELVHIVDITNGARLETYVIEGQRGSGVIGINGAAAHLVHPGDLVILISYAQVEDAEARTLVPSVVHVDADNRIVALGSDASEPVPGSDTSRSPQAASAL